MIGVIALLTSLAAPRGAQGSGFIRSIDTMKLSKDHAREGFTISDAQATDLAATMPVSHITDDVQMNYPVVMGQWASQIHGDNKSVWFRLGTKGCNEPHGDLGDGYPTFAPGYLTKLHHLMLTHPSYFRSGDILDGDAEAENSCWWANHYGCHVQSSCRPCNTSGTNTPCAPIYQFNNFLVEMTRQENMDLAKLAITGVISTVHSTDPGTAGLLYPSTVRAMGNIITVDAYPDQNTTEPAAAANAWLSALSAWHQGWLERGLSVSILVGEWGYSNAIAVIDSVQEAVISAEVTRAFPKVPYLLGTNYWVGPGWAGDGGFTQIFYQDAAGVWHFRPAANDVAKFYAGISATASVQSGVEARLVGRGQR
jgi:hypothetical protein